MTSRQTTAEKSKYFDLDIHGIGYLNRVREVTPEEWLAFSQCHHRGATRTCRQRPAYPFRVWWWSVKRQRNWVRQLMPAVEADLKVLVGFHLSDLQAETFTFKNGDRTGTTGISLKSRLLRFHWIIGRRPAIPGAFDREPQRRRLTATL